jgi:hypothetical protein
MSSLTPGPDEDAVSEFTGISFQAPTSLADDFRALAMSNSGTVSAEMRIAMRKHLADMKAQGRAA